MKAIPTVYGGTQFRSRLEARFAAWFDIWGWSWDYEPFDCDGWIPDFRTGGVLWEVKPTPEACVAARQKVDVAQHDLPVMLSCGPFGGPEVGSLGVCYIGELRHQGSSHFVVPDREWRFERDPALLALPAPADIVGSWREAGNRVQWRSPRGR